MAPPNPAFHLIFRRVLRQEDRLGIVNDHHVGGEVELFGVLLVDLMMQLEVTRAKRDGQTLQAVVQRFGDAVKVGRPGDHLPPHVQSQFLHQGNHPPEDFGHASARLAWN